MMRAILIVVGLSALTIMQLGTPPRTKTSAPDRFEQLAVDASLSGDTLQTADRREIHRLQHEAPVQLISFVEPTPPSDRTATNPKKDSGTVGNRTDDKKQIVRKPRPGPKHTEPNESKPKPANSNKAVGMVRSKTMVEVKPCRPNAFDGLLQALNLSSRCQT
jgi:hypothetical protein